MNDRIKATIWNIRYLSNCNEYRHGYSADQVERMIQKLRDDPEFIDGWRSLAAFAVREPERAKAETHMCEQCAPIWLAFRGTGE